jgi:hypothetical protein
VVSTPKKAYRYADNLAPESQSIIGALPAASAHRMLYQPAYFVGLLFVIIIVAVSRFEMPLRPLFLSGLL